MTKIAHDHERVRLGERSADSAGHEGADAGGADEGSEEAGEEGAGDAATISQLAAHAHQRRADLEHAEQVEADGEHHQREDGGDPGVLQLEAHSGRGVASRLQEDEDGADRSEADHHAGEIGQAIGARLLRIMRGVDEARGLDGEHRQHARHQVEDEATEEGQSQRDQQLAEREGPFGRCAADSLERGVGDAGRQGGRRGGEFPAAHVAVRQLHADDAVERDVAGLGEVGRFHFDRDAIGADADDLRRGVLDLRADGGRSGAIWRRSRRRQGSDRPRRS